MGEARSCTPLPGDATSKWRAVVINRAGGGVRDRSGGPLSVKAGGMAPASGGYVAAGGGF